MKKILTLLLTLALLLTLSACGGKQEEAAQTEAAAVPGVDAESGRWIGLGGCFRLEPCEEESEAQSVFTFGGREYCFHDDWDGRRITRGDETIYETANIVDGLRAAETGIWICEELRDGGDWYARFVLIDGDGGVQDSLDVRLPSDSYPRSFSTQEGLLLLNCSDALRVYSREGELQAEIPHAEWAGQLLNGGDGVLYYVEEGEQAGGSVSTIDVSDGAFRQLFRYERGTLCKGDGMSPFLLILDRGIDHLQADGSTEPLVIWDECGLGVSGLMNVKARPDGSYLLTGAASPMLLCPAEPSELKARTKLTLGVLLRDGTDFAMGSSNLIRSVSAFNARSTDCYVELQDLSEGGALTGEQARLKLNTRLIAGEGPDMLAFNSWSLSPFPFVRKGLLRDLDAEFLRDDPDIASEDIVIAPMLQNDLGGLYLLGEYFYVETRYGLQERFGKVWGWDYDTYRAIDRETPQGGMVMYNLTREYFLHESASRFLRSAIDWQSGSCDFDNEEFVRLLEACRDMRETPEDPNNMVFGSSAQLMDGGYIVTALTMINSPESYARLQREMGKPLSYIGFPTPDGSCGTDLSFGDAIGVLSGSAHPQACWQFLKYSLTHSKAELPVYRPLLEARLAEAQRDRSGEETGPFGQLLSTPMTDGEVQGFCELLGHIEHTTLCDMTALDIIKEEFAAVLAGNRSPQDAARLVQSRVSLYVSEQGG